MPDVEYFSTELLAGIRKEREAGKLPPNIALGMEVLYNNYKTAVTKYA